MNDHVNIQDFPHSLNIKPGGYVEPGVIMSEGVTVGANAVVLSGDLATGVSQPTIIKAGVMIGANSTICPGVTLGERAYIKPGSVVVRSVPPLAIVEGNPAIITGYLATYADNSTEYSQTHGGVNTGVSVSKVTGVTFHRFKFVSDLRGNLTVGEFEREVPFIPKRYFLVLDVPTAETRGEHAHRACEQFLICVKGTCSVVADNGNEREEFVLDSPSNGLYLPPMVWGIQYKYSADAVLLVFASHNYDADDYIRDYDEFISLVGNKK